MKQFFSRFLRHQKGAAFIEFAMVFPFMFLLLFGGVELGRYILIIQKVEKAAYVITDIVGQESPATSPGLDGQISVQELQTNVFPQLTRLMGLYGDPSRETVIMSSVINTPTRGLQMRWQQFAGTLPVSSVVTGGGPQKTAGDACTPVSFIGDPAVMPLLATMTRGENMIVGEVFYSYTPIVGSLFGVGSATPNFTGGFSIKPQIIGRRLFLHPRNGELVDLPPAHPVKTDALGNPDIHPCD